MVLPTDAPAWLRQVIEQLASAQVRSEERFAAVETQLERLVATQEQTTALLAQHSAQLDGITARLDRHDDRLGGLTGWALETRFISRAASLLPQVGVRDVQPLFPAQLLERELNAALKDGHLTEDAAAELRLADLVCLGRDRQDGHAVAIVVEVSARVAVRDVERAADRAKLAAPLAEQTLAVVAGGRIDRDAEVRAQERGVTWLRWSGT